MFSGTTRRPASTAWCRLAEAEPSPLPARPPIQLVEDFQEKEAEVAQCKVEIDNYIGVLEKATENGDAHEEVQDDTNVINSF